jgi:L-ascorbate metabolism protein UlaG (beta-lactamase superfamily)
MTKVYLRQDVQVEPLIDSWYAWSHLIPPATAARNLTNRHVRIMQSYIAAPSVHANAVRNPQMLGGPFIDYNGGRVDEIKDLLSNTLANRADLVSLSEAIGELDKTLQANAKGQSLLKLYPTVPDALRGLVELVYDLNHHPSFRIIEPLIYRSHYGRPDGQSVLLSQISGDDRPFVLSTPRLSDPNSLNLKLPFRHEALDALFTAKTKPTVFEDLADLCQVSKQERSLFRTYFTETEPQPYSRYTGAGVRWRYFGHACILLETAALNILVDPVLSYTYESGISRYTYADLPDRLDYVLITHNHQDHVLLETLLQLRHKIERLVVPRSGGGGLQDPSLKLTLEHIGFKHIIDLDELECLDFDCGSVTGVPFFGEHADLNVRTKLGYLVELGQHRVLFAADSCNIESRVYERLHSELGDVHTLFIGMECDGAPLSWIYGPLHTHSIERAYDESRRLNGSNCAQVMSIIDSLKSSNVFVYAMGQEPWLRYIMSVVYTPDSNPIVQSKLLLESCLQRGISAERLFGEREMVLAI